VRGEEKTGQNKRRNVCGLITCSQRSSFRREIVNQLRGLTNQSSPATKSDAAVFNTSLRLGGVEESFESVCLFGIGNLLTLLGCFLYSAVVFVYGYLGSVIVSMYI